MGLPYGGKGTSQFICLGHIPHTDPKVSSHWLFFFPKFLFLDAILSVTLQERHPGDSKNYNECIRHETIRVAVCDMMEGKCPCPEPLRGVMEKSFLEYYDFYEVACKDRLHLQGQTMQDPFGEKRGHFDYQSLLMRLGLIRQKVLERLHNENAEMDSDSSSSGTETDLHGSLRV